MSKIVVGVLRGGPSSEYDVSLTTGGSVLQHLPEKYIGHDIFISQDGVWHSYGLARPPEKILRKVDVVFNALHKYMEPWQDEDELLQRSTPGPSENVIELPVFVPPNVPEELTFISTLTGSPLKLVSI